MATTKARVIDEPVDVYCISENIAATVRNEHWSIRKVVPSKQSGQVHQRRKRESDAEAERTWKRLLPSSEDRLVKKYPTKTEKVRVTFSGQHFLSVAIKRPEGWEPKHPLDLPEVIDDNTDQGYEWTVHPEIAADWQTREEAIRDTAEVNGGDPNNTDPHREADDWRVTVERGSIIPQSGLLFTVQLSDGVGHIEPLGICYAIVHHTTVHSVFGTLSAHLKAIHYLSISPYDGSKSTAGVCRHQFNCFRDGFNIAMAH